MNNLAYKDLYGEGFTVTRDRYSKYLEKGKMHVIVSFDSCKQVSLWNKLLDFASKYGVKYTFFVSGVYFLPDKDAFQYVHPADPNKKGESVIRFGGTEQEVADRKSVVLKAASEGHDIQNHLCGHFDGASSWTESMWRSEFGQFNNMVSFLPRPTHHIRFPYLLHNSDVLPVLKENSVYTATSVIQKNIHNVSDFFRISPDNDKDAFEFIEFPIWFIRSLNVPLFDFNLYELSLEKKFDADTARKQMVASYLDEAARCLETGSPLFISHHFWDYHKGAYIEALKDSLVLLKERYDASFITVSDLYAKIKQGG